LPSVQARADQELTKEIRQIHAHSREMYGSIRVRQTLRDRGRAVGHRRVARLMRLAGLRGVHGRRRRVRTTVADPAATPAQDRVDRACAPAAIGDPNRVWLADITSVATRQARLDLAVTLVGFSRRVVGWAMADHLRTELGRAALQLALRHRRPAPPGGRPGAVHRPRRRLLRSRCRRVVSSHRSQSGGVPHFP
jgi:putative transposase